MKKLTGSADWTCYDDPEVGRSWYFAPHNRGEPPYLRQIQVEAILDIDSHGRIAGIELIDRTDEFHPPLPLAVAK